MATQSQGIQQLLTAEKKAAETIAEARKRKNLCWSLELLLVLLVWLTIGFDVNRKNQET